MVKGVMAKVACSAHCFAQHHLFLKKTANRVGKRMLNTRLETGMQIVQALKKAANLRSSWPA